MRNFISNTLSYHITAAVAVTDIIVMIIIEIVYDNLKINILR